MKKRLMILLGIAVLILAFAGLSFAQGYGRGGFYGHGYGPGHMYNSDLSEEELEAFHDERMETMREGIAQYLEEGKITQEQYDNWIQHLDDMDDYHDENGFTPGDGFGRGFGRGFGGCHNFSSNNNSIDE